jgi:serine/threonine protein kinase
MVGRTVLQYQLLEKLGAGGMGDIYKAQDTRLNRVVAIKVLTKAATGDAERKRRFIQEAQAASALNHPNIITIHDIISEGDTEFMVMEYVNGKTLVDLIPKGGLRVPQVLKYSVQMADALQVAHNAGIVHRDLKPGNVMVTESGLVKILDFGLAKLTDRGPLSHVSETDATQTMGDAPLTVEGSIIGTVSYMSPEQAQGRKVDTRSDIFSFGVVLYEMLTGVRAFAGDSALSTLSAILRDDVRPIAETSPEVPPQVDLVINRCLRKLPDDRWQSMKDVQMALAALKHESDSGVLYRARLSQIQPPQPAAPPPVPAAGAPAPVSKKEFPTRVLAGVLSGIVLLAAIGGGTAWLIRHRKHAAPPPQEVAATAPAPPPQDVVSPAPAPPDAPAPDAAAAPPADATLTNDNIIELVKGKVSPTLIMSQIRSSKTNFTLTTAELIRLTHAGVPDNVIEQMRNPKRALATSGTSTPPVSAAKQTAPVVATQPPPQQPQPPPQPAPQPPPPQQQQTQEVTPPPAQPQPPPKPVVNTVMVVLNDGTPFNIVLAEDVPDSAEEGRTLRFTVTDGVRLGDAVAIAKGATVIGAIAEKKKGGLFGGSKMTLKLIQAETVDGKKVNVRALSANRPEGAYRPVENGARKSKDVVASAGTPYVAYIDGNQTVAAHK